MFLNPKSDGVLHLMFVLSRWPVLTITTIDQPTTLGIILMSVHLAAKTRKRSVLLHVYK